MGMPFIRGVIGAVFIGFAIGMAIAFFFPMEVANYHRSIGVVPAADPFLHDVFSSTSSAAGRNILPVASSSRPLLPAFSTSSMKEIKKEESFPYTRAEKCTQMVAKNAFYTDPARQSLRTFQGLERSGNTEDSAMLTHIACAPSAIWLSGGTYEAATTLINRTIRDALRQNKIIVYTLYNVPDHHVAQWHSQLPDNNYLGWVENIARTIGTNPAWVVLEPDALPMSMAYTPADRDKRISEIRSAVDIFKATAPNVRVYIDIGHDHWLTLAEAASLLDAVGISNAYGFSLNVSNYRPTEAVSAYGHLLSQKVENKTFIIDTSRNGNGNASDHEWCNASGRAIGPTSQHVPDDPLIDAYLWVKPPGESDGECNGGPTAGVFWLEYALDLIRASKR